MSRLFVLVYGVACYLVFFCVFLYSIGFVGGFGVPKHIDSGPVEPLGIALLVNVVILGLFAVQHSVMARPWFKAWWTKIVPKPVERSTYVLAASLILALLYWQWRPLVTVIWNVENPAGRWALQGLYLAGWLMVLLSTFGVNHFDLFGLRQVWLYFQGQEYSPIPFKSTGLYGIVRHPIMFSFLVAFWATPKMTAGHLLFSIATTGYIVVGVWFEERDLVRYVPEYAEYRTRTSAVIPFVKK